MQITKNATMPFDDAKVFLQQLNDFYTAGWMKIMGQ